MPSHPPEFKSSCLQFQWCCTPCYQKYHVAPPMLEIIFLLVMLLASADHCSSLHVVSEKMAPAGRSRAIDQHVRYWSISAFQQGLEDLTISHSTRVVIRKRQVSTHQRLSDSSGPLYTRRQHHAVRTLWRSAARRCVRVPHKHGTPGRGDSDRSVFPCRFRQAKQNEMERFMNQ
jgi:hypothetical protein